MSVALFAILACCLLLPFSERKLWIGFFEFTIRLHSRSGAPVKSVLFDTARRDPERSRVEDYPWENLRKANDIEESRVFIDVKCTGCDDGWGRRLSYGELGRVLLQVEFADGTIVRRIVDIPTGRGPRETTVELP